MLYNVCKDKMKIFVITCNHLHELSAVINEIEPAVYKRNISQHKWGNIYQNISSSNHLITKIFPVLILFILTKL